MTEPIAKQCACGRSYTETEWQAQRQTWGIRSRTVNRTLEMVRCDKCGSAISRRVQ